jgi:polysaccharide biosynthesis transport protein
MAYMNSPFSSLVDALRRWAWLLTLGLLLGVAVAFIANRLTPPVYKTTVTLLVNVTSGGEVDDLSSGRVNARGRLVFKNGDQGEMADLRLIDQRIPTYAQMLVLPVIVTAALDELGLNYSVDSVPAEISVNLVKNTQLLELRINSTDAQLAVDLARQLPSAFNQHYAAQQTAHYKEIQASLAQEISLVQVQLAQTQTQIATLSEPPNLARAAELAHLQSEQTELSQSLTGLTLANTRLQVSLTQVDQTLIVVEPAIRPRATRSSLWRDLLLGSLIGLSAAVGLASLIGLMDDRVRSAVQLEHAVQLPVLGTIGRWPANTPDLIAWRVPRAPEVEALRALRTNLRFASVDYPLRTLLITSDGPGQGKSAIAANLAVVMAQAGLRVALVDADLRRPTLHHQFAQANRLGLTDALLSDPAGWSTLPLISGVPNLSLAVSGALPANPAELLGSRRMQQWLEYLRQTHDIVIIDAPPVLVVTDAEVLSHAVDGVILVAAYGLTRLKAAAVSKQQLDRLGARCVGVVLNRLPSRALPYQRSYALSIATAPTETTADAALDR